MQQTKEVRPRFTAEELKFLYACCDLSEKHFKDLDNQREKLQYRLDEITSELKRGHMDYSLMQELKETRSKLEDLNTQRALIWKRIWGTAALKNRLKAIIDGSNRHRNTFYFGNVETEIFL